MRKVITLLCVAAMALILHGQWGAQQDNIVALADTMLSQMPPNQLQAEIATYWQNVLQAAISGNVIQQQKAVALSSVIRKYDAQYDAHFAAVVQAISSMLSMSQMQGLGQMPMFMQMPINGFSGGGSGGGASQSCPICHGSGSCKICHGTGTSRSYGQAVPCDPKCSACGGTGLR